MSGRASKNVGHLPFGQVDFGKFFEPCHLNKFVFNNVKSSLVAKAYLISSCIGNSLVVISGPQMVIFLSTMYPNLSEYLQVV